MTNVHQNTDVMVLSAAHSLMVSNVPEVVIDARLSLRKLLQGYCQLQ